MAYQWLFNGTPLPGQHDLTYTVAKLTSANVGNYSVRLINAHGTFTSAGAAFALLAAPSGYAAEVLATDPVAYWRLNEATGASALDYCSSFTGTNPQYIQGASARWPSMALPALLTPTRRTFAGTTGEACKPACRSPSTRTRSSFAAWITDDAAANNACIAAKAMAMG